MWFGVSGTLSVVVAVLIAVSSRAGDWPGWRGPSADGTSAETGLPIIWSEPASDDPDEACADLPMYGKCDTSSSENILWKIRIPSWGNSTPVIVDGSIYLTSQTDDNRLWVFCVDKHSGECRWETELGTARIPRASDAGEPHQGARGIQRFHEEQNLATPSVVADADVVVATFGNGDLAGLDAATGEVLWRHNLASDYAPFSIWWGYASSPALWNDAVITICLQDNLVELVDRWEPRPSYIVAHHRKTGERLWYTERPTDARGEPCDAYTTPLIVRDIPGIGPDGGSGDLVIVYGGLILDAYAPATGERIWEMRGFEGNRVITGTTVADGVLYQVEGMRNRLFAAAVTNSAITNREPGQFVDRSIDELLWTHSGTGGTPDSSTPVVATGTDGGIVFIVTDNGIAKVIDTSDGTLLWNDRLGGNFRSSPLAADGKVYFTGTDGVTLVYTASVEKKKIATNRLATDEIRASIAVSDGKIYIRSRDFLYCIGTR